jgi:phosphatidylinositol alpha-1,6-mannosyltransferase
MDRQKDQATLIRAVSAANMSSPIPIEVVLAGDGPLEDQLRKLAHETGESSSIHFLGRLSRDEVYAMLSEIDVYAMPSLWEGFSAAALEALASGTPAVFSDIPPFRLPYGDVAMYHPPGDHAELADRTVELATCDEQRRKLGEAGRNLVTAKYTVERIVEMYADIYETLAN